MKRFLVAMLLALSLPALPAHAQQPEPNRFDVNRDGKVAPDDISCLIDYLLNGAGEESSAGNYDVNRDGKVAPDDISCLIDYLLNGPRGQEYTVNGVTFLMVDVKGGTFTMGATEEQTGDASDTELPTHEVTLSDYSIGETEVTQELWLAVMGTYNPSGFSGDLQRPVEQVSWSNCQTFITKLNQLTGLTFRLPTEAEWEYAARGGSKSRGYKYAGSDDVDAVAWYRSNSDNATHRVGTKAPNELGLYDMSGNVWEWCQDWYDSYGSAPQTNPQGPSTGTRRVMRGGSWANNDAARCRVSYRLEYYPSLQENCNGLRLAL